MKKHLLLAASIWLLFASVCFAQPQATPSPSPKPKPAMTKAQLLKKLSAAETKLWEAWKNKDVKPFKAAQAADFVLVYAAGVSGKNDVVKMIPSMPCEVKSFKRDGGTAGKIAGLHHEPRSNFAFNGTDLWIRPLVFSAS